MLIERRFTASAGCWLACANTAVAISSLEVTYLKLFSVDITDRVKPYVTERGIDIAKADLPSGSHKVRFSIRDIQNNLTERTLRIKIV